MVLAVRGDHELAVTSGPDAMLLHETVHPIFAHAVPVCNQFFPHLGPVVFLFDLGMDGPNVDQQGFITDALVRLWLAGLVRILAPPVLKVAAGTDPLVRRKPA